MDKWTRMLGALSLLDDYSPASRAIASPEQRKRLFHETLEAMRADMMRDAVDASTPVPMPDARVKAAAEFLARWLTVTYGADAGPHLANAQDLLSGREQHELGFRVVVVERRDYEEAAKPLTDPYCGAHGDARPSPRGGTGLCVVCDAKMRLADAVLAQVRGSR